ncbi:MAG: rRNA maturation RNase YbeY [Ignavibacteriae bacterium]|nr:rRNA maturation RNase YbeY [Ignavibacteriota bacterium]
MVVNFLFESEIPHVEKNYFKRLVRRIIRVILNDEKIVCGTINIRFCDDKEIKIYNKKYLSHNYETDILTFYYENDVNSIDSDIMISVDTIKRNSIKYKSGFENELIRVIIHGVLHLCGYKDSTKKQKAIMREKENYYLKKLLINAG